MKSLLLLALIPLSAFAQDPGKAIPVRLCAAEVARYGSPFVKKWVDEVLTDNVFVRSQGETRARLKEMALAFFGDRRFRVDRWFVIASLLGATHDELKPLYEAHVADYPNIPNNELERHRFATVLDYFHGNEEGASENMVKFFSTHNVETHTDFYQAMARDVAFMGGGEAELWELADFNLLNLMKIGNRAGEQNQSWMLAFDNTIDVLAQFRSSEFAPKAATELIRLGDGLLKLGTRAGGDAWFYRVGALRAYAATGNIRSYAPGPIEPWGNYLFGPPTPEARERMQFVAQELLDNPPPVEVAYSDIFDALVGLEDPLRMKQFGRIAMEHYYLVGFDFYLYAGEIESARDVIHWMQTNTPTDVLASLIRCGYKKGLRRYQPKSPEAEALQVAALEKTEEELLQIGRDTRHLRSHQPHDMALHEVQYRLGFRPNHPYLRGPFKGVRDVLGAIEQLRRTLNIDPTGMEQERAMAERFLMASAVVNTDQAQVAIEYYYTQGDRQALKIISERLFRTGMQLGFGGDLGFSEFNAGVMRAPKVAPMGFYAMTLVALLDEKARTEQP